MRTRSSTSAYINDSAGSYNSLNPRRLSYQAAREVKQIIVGSSYPSAYNSLQLSFTATCIPFHIVKPLIAFTALMYQNHRISHQRLQNLSPRWLAERPQMALLSLRSMARALKRKERLCRNSSITAFITPSTSELHEPKFNNTTTALPPAPPKVPYNPPKLPAKASCAGI